MPTTINNVETLAAVPHIIMRGAEWYKGLCLGNPKSTGTKLISVCGHIQRPGNYEVTMGIPDEGAHLRHGRRHAAGPDPQGGHSRRLLGADHDRGGGGGLPAATTRASSPRARCWARPGSS